MYLLYYYSINLVTIVVVECMFVLVKVEETTRETTLTNKCTPTCLLLVHINEIRSSTCGVQIKH